MFSADVSYSGAFPNPLHTEDKGGWLRIGDRKGLRNVMFFKRDDQSVSAGIAGKRVRRKLALPATPRTSRGFFVWLQR